MSFSANGLDTYPRTLELYYKSLTAILFEIGRTWNSKH